MNVLLAQSYIGKSESPVFPLGLSCLAVSLGGHKVKLFDPNVSMNPYDELVNVLVTFKPDIVGISVRNIDSTNKRKVVFYYKYFKKMVEIIQDTLGDRTKIVVGGPGFSMFAQKIMHDEPRIDYGVFGEGETIFLELIENLESPENVKGVFFKKNGRILFTGASEYPAIDTFPFSDRLSIDVATYQGFPDAIGVETKRGCALGCVYCPYGFLNGKLYRFKNPKLVVDEIEFLVINKGINHFIFIDSVFNFPLDHAEAICREMINRKPDVSWSAWFHDKYITKAFANLARHAGCNRFILSPDGFSNRALKRLGKSQRKSDVLRTFEILKNLDGVEISYNFFKNPPGQSLAAFLNLIGFAFKAKSKLGSRVHFEFNSIRVEPNTALYPIALKEGFITPSDDLLYPKNYTNPKTRYIERLFDVILRLKGK